MEANNVDKGGYSLRNNRKLNPLLPKSHKGEPILTHITLGSDEGFDSSVGLKGASIIDYFECLVENDIEACTPVEFPFSIVGALLMDDGDVLDIANHPNTLNPSKSSAIGDDYWYTLHCTVLEWNREAIITELSPLAGLATLADVEKAVQALYITLTGKISCNLDLCLGRDSGVGNCVYLRYSGPYETTFEGEFYPDFIALSGVEFLSTVIGGTGVFAGAIGEAYVVFNKIFNTGGIYLAWIPSNALEGLWDGFGV